MQGLILFCRLVEIALNTPLGGLLKLLLVELDRADAAMAGNLFVQLVDVRLHELLNL